MPPFIAICTRPSIDIRQQRTQRSEGLAIRFSSTSRCAHAAD
jgi:hypothetical protein